MTLSPAALAARKISDHHKEHADCARGELRPVRGELRRVPCPKERALFKALDKART